MFPGLKKKTKISDKVRSDKFSHWIDKAKQQRCAKCEKKQHYIYFCKKIQCSSTPRMF